MIIILYLYSLKDENHSVHTTHCWGHLTRQRLFVYVYVMYKIHYYYYNTGGRYKYILYILMGRSLKIGVRYVILYTRAVCKYKIYILLYSQQEYTEWLKYRVTIKIYNHENSQWWRFLVIFLCIERKGNIYLIPDFSF